MAYDTVQDFLDRARILLLDETAPYRYSTASLVLALNDALAEARRIRPDIMRGYFGTDLPEFAVGDVAEDVPIDQMYRSAFNYYIVGMAQLRDDEDVTDARASNLLNKFVAQLTAVA